MSRKQWYIVTGRQCGDDEDGCLVTYAANQDVAEENFKKELREINSDPEIGREGCLEEKAVYVNWIVACGKEEPEIISGP